MCLSQIRGGTWLGGYVPVPNSGWHAVARGGFHSAPSHNFCVGQEFGDSAQSGMGDCCEQEDWGEDCEES